MDEARKLINEIEQQLIEVKYHLDGGRIESAAIKSEFVKRPSIELNELLNKMISVKKINLKEPDDIELINDLLNSKKDK